MTASLETSPPTTGEVVPTDDSTSDDPVEAVAGMLAWIDEKRAALGI